MIALGLRRCAPFSLPPQAIIESKANRHSAGADAVFGITGKSMCLSIYLSKSERARLRMAMDVVDKYEDPSIVGSMSGHKEGSKALARYRDID